MMMVCVNIEALNKPSAKKQLEKIINSDLVSTTENYVNNKLKKLRSVDAYASSTNIERQLDNG